MAAVGFQIGVLKPIVIQQFAIILVCLIQEIPVAYRNIISCRIFAELSFQLALKILIDRRFCLLIRQNGR